MGIFTIISLLINLTLLLITGFTDPGIIPQLNPLNKKLKKIP